MKILVTVKPVLNPDEKVKILPDGTGIAQEGIKMVINPFDEIAVEEALRLKEAHGAEVVTVTVGRAECEQQIRSAMAMGADRAILVETVEPLDPLAIAKCLAKVAGDEAPDLVITGKQAVDADDNQVAQILSALLSWPQATFASKVELLDGSAKARVTREVDGGLETVEVPLPAVISTDLRLNEPRYASLPGILKARKKTIAVLPAASLGIETAPKLRLLSFAAPKERVGGRKVESVADLLDKLRNEARVL
jgi:electron transfer flavoprotein beta subunit